MNSSSNTSSSTDSSDDELFRYIRQRRARKIIKHRNCHDQDLTDEEFFERFRFTKITVHRILTYIYDTIKYTSLRNNCLTPMQQLLLTLRFYASGSMLIVVGDFIGVTKATASRTVRRVSLALANLRPEFIKMPETEEERKNTQAGFYKIAKFPKVLGTIDCTHIKIQSAGTEDAEVYRNRKGYFSYNVQTICGFDLKINNIVARWPGSCHDQTVFNNSRIKFKFESGIYKDCFLLGDSGYRNTEYLLTPLLHPADAAQELYNTAHILTRNTVERQYGIWKRRFPILSLGMKVSTDLVRIIVVATAVLHNIAIDNNEPLSLDDELIVESIESYQNDVNEAENNSARHRLIYNYFRNLV